MCFDANSNKLGKAAVFGRQYLFLGWSPTGDAFKTSHQTCSTSVSTRLISVCWNQFYVSVNTDVLNTFNSIVVNVPPYQSYGQEISYRELLLLNIITGATASMQQQQQCRDKCPDKEDIWYEKKQTKLLSKYHLPSASPSHSHTHTHTKQQFEKEFSSLQDKTYMQNTPCHNCSRKLRPLIYFH